MKCSIIYLGVSMDYWVRMFQWTLGFGCFNIGFGCFNELLGLCVSKDYEVVCFNGLWGVGVSMDYEVLGVSMDYGVWVFQWAMGFGSINGL